MFSRLGAIITVISLVWLAGVAGADEALTDQAVFSPVMPLLVKAALGLVGAIIGLRMMLGGATVCRK